MTYPSGSWTSCARRATGRFTDDRFDTAERATGSRDILERQVARPAKPQSAPPIHKGDHAPPGTEGTGEAICAECHGSGRRNGNCCPNCGGTGKVIEGIGGA